MTAFEEILQGITTPIEVSYGKDEEFTGSGFFYHERTNNVNNNSDNKYWLITNRHVILGEKVERLPSRITFYLRMKHKYNNITWKKINLFECDINQCCYIHSDGSIDVSAISISKFIKVETIESQKNGYELVFHAINSNLMPNEYNHVEAGEAIITVGYPFNMYDKVNYFPILTLHLLSSKWGNRFNGNRCFLIDRALKRGSSGSLVITIPNRITVDQGEIVLHTEKQFLFLGIYSEVINSDFRNTGFGIVWYGELIEEIINNRQQFSL